MPEAAQQHSNQKVRVSAGFAAATAPQADVEVIAQPGGKTDVPPLPEFAQAGSGVRQGKIDHEVEAKEPGGAPRDVRVTGKIAINLQGERHRSEHDDRRG